MQNVKGNPSPAVIRDFRVGDYVAMLALWKSAGLPCKPEGRDAGAEIERQSREPTAIYLVAEAEGKIVGAVLGTHDGRKGWVNRLAVSPPHRRRGLALELLAEVERRLAALGIGIFACLVEDWNVDSKAFFEKAGYKAFDGMTYFTKRLLPEI
jgi:ribosomal protein S18 acetylase RimI-like enzyme